MTMGTNERVQPHSRTRSTRGGVLIYGLSGAVFALLFVMSIPSANTWYLILGSCILAATAVFNVAKAVIALRRDDYTTSE